MNKFGRGFAIFLGILLTIISSIVSGVNFFDGKGLNTEKIEKNLEKLKGYSWFNEVYKMEEHQRSFYLSLKIRKYLQSSMRVNRLIRCEKERVKFILMLEEVARLRNK